jgi:hypothetical protein
MKQLSLFDILLADDPAPTREILWALHHRHKHDELVLNFKAEHGEEPVFRLQLLPEFLDVFFTHPKNAAAIDTRTGKLVQSSKINSIVWDKNAEYRWRAERPKHISPQILAILKGVKRREEWTLEIERVFHYRDGARNDVIDLLLAMGLSYSFEKGGFQGYCQVFANPAAIKAFEREAALAGVVYSARRFSDRKSP